MQFAACSRSHEVTEPRAAPLSPESSALKGFLQQTSADPQGLLIELGAAKGELRVINHGPALRLRFQIGVEQFSNGVWQPIPVTNFALQEQCAARPPPDCVTLEQGATLKPLPWTGFYCASQCPSPCRLDGHVPTGSYRFDVSTCDKAEKFTSAEFKLTDPDR
jgi:hypothetical protein